jgi:salicylate hydroxylase
MVAGPCLKDITAWDKVALIGDASHPLSGAFGSGVAFAMEDGWILARAIEYSINSGTVLRDALEIFQRIRGPYYERMYVSFITFKLMLVLRADYVQVWLS